MAELIATIEEVKKHNSSATVKLKIASIKSFIDEAIDKNIIPAMGREMYNELKAAKPTIIIDSNLDVLLNYAQKVIVNLALGYYADFGAVQVSDAGIHVQSDANLRAASDKKIIALRKQSLQNGFAAIELMVEFLESNLAVFTTYAASAEHSQNRERFINSSKEFSKAGSIQVTPQLFETLKGEISKVERDCIENLLGEDLTSTIRALVTAGTGSAIQLKLIQKIQLAVAPLTLAGIIPYRSISIDSEGIYQLSETVGGISGNVENRQPAEDRRLQVAMNRLCNQGESELESLRKWLNDHISDFEGYTESTIAPMSKINDDSGSAVYFM